MKALIVYDTKHDNGATYNMAKCIADTLESMGIEATLCRARDQCPDPKSFNLVIVGSPIYYEHPMETVLEFIDKNNGLEGLRVAVFITCFAASKRIPAPIRNTVVKRYLNMILKHVKGKVIAYKPFKGWLREPDPNILKECATWIKHLLTRIDSSLLT